MKTKFFMMIAAIVMLSFSSCQKDTTLIDQTSIDLADDDAVADAVFEDVFNTADNATIILDQIGQRVVTQNQTVVADSCPAITVTHPGRWSMAKNCNS